MISVLICACDEEARLVRSLAALAPLAVRGLVADVIIADCGSRNATLAIADAAGCAIIEACRDRVTAVGRAAGLARKEWLLGLVSGDLPDDALAIAARRHMARTESAGAPRAAALLALAAARGQLRRTTIALAFDLFGVSSPQARRVLAPRAEAHLLGAAGRVWRGARLRERVVSSE